MAFSLIHSGAAPATGKSEILSPKPPALTISAHAIRIRLLSTQTPQPKTGGMPTASHTSLKPSPAKYAASGVQSPAFARELLENNLFGQLIHYFL